MERSDIVELIVESVQEIAAIQVPPIRHEVSDQSRLYGKHGCFDSLGLVSVILGLEQKVNDRLETTISIADERAMSQQNSPFRTVGSLADYVLLLIQDQLRQAA